MNIGTIILQKGEKQTGYIRTAYTADGAEVHVPLMTVCGAQDGPVLWINAGVHGEELSGIFAIHKLIDQLDPAALSGVVVASPGCNPLAIRGCQKVTVEDHLDMDMQFPGRPDGWLSEQMAYHFFNAVKQTANYLIDLHALGGVNAAPYTIYKSLPGVEPKINEISRAMALNMGIGFNCYVDLATATGELPGNVSCALDIQAVLHGIPSIMAEMGAGNRIIWENVDIVTEGLLNNMRYLGMLPGETQAFTGQKIITKRNFPCSHRGGLAVPAAEVGTVVKKGQTMARIVDFTGKELERMDAPQDLLLIGALENPVVHSGKIVVVCGLEWEEVN